MSRHTEASLVRYGAISVVVMALIMAAAFNLSKFPGFGGTTYAADFTDASGLHVGSEVQVGGIRVGRVEKVRLDGPQVRVDFSVDHGVDFGGQSRASVEVLNLLGEKYLEIEPAGSGQQSPDTPIPTSRTEAAYDIVGVFSDLTTTTESINKDQLKQAFNVLSQTVHSAAPEIKASFDGIAKLSHAVSSRDAEVRHLFASSRSVSSLLAARSDDLVHLMGSADQIFAEVQKRREAIHTLLVNARTLVVQLKGVATDNQEQVAPALHQVDGLLNTLNEKDTQLKATLSALGPYVSILSNIIGTGPWFDAYAVNLAAIPTGEFLPGSGPQ
jgi:phospholipid/cholesterol/gamma-HCH transport system substrate-binding protein